MVKPEEWEVCGYVTCLVVNCSGTWVLCLSLHFVLVSMETWDSFGVYTGHGDTQEVPAIVNSKRQLMEDNRYSEHIDFYNI